MEHDMHVHVYDDMQTCTIFNMAASQKGEETGG